MRGAALRARTLKTAQGRNESAKQRKRKGGTGSESCGAKKSGGQRSVSIVLGTERRPEARSSEEERRVDAKALIADEGRDKLRKAVGSRK